MLLSIKFLEIDQYFKILLPEENIDNNIQEIKTFIFCLCIRHKLNPQHFFLSKQGGKK